MAALHKRCMYARESVLIATPIGAIRIEGDRDSIESIRIAPGPVPRDHPQQPSCGPALTLAITQLKAWFDGKLTEFDIPLAAATPRGAVLRAGMISIPYGDTMSYGSLARAIGSSARAVGQACARNPFPIVVPCHRVLNSDGALGFYSAGDGPATKQWLLDHERRHSQG